jgi:hypothetical protein
MKKQCYKNNIVLLCYSVFLYLFVFFFPFSFSLIVDAETFYDNEDGTDLQLELFDKNEHALKPSSWIQFNPDTREIYGL